MARFSTYSRLVISFYSIHGFTWPYSIYDFMIASQSSEAGSGRLFPPSYANQVWPLVVKPRAFTLNKIATKNDTSGCENHKICKKQMSNLQILGFVF